MTRQQDEAGAAGYNLSWGCDGDDWDKTTLRQLVVLLTQCDAEYLINGQVDKTSQAKMLSKLLGMM